MKAGDRVLLSIPAADRDPLEFPDADRFDIDRASNRHLRSPPARTVASDRIWPVWNFGLRSKSGTDDSRVRGCRRR